MAALKEEILIAQHVYNIVAKFPRLKTCILRLRNSAERFPILCNASLYQQFKTVDPKPEILISQSVHNIIAIQFQRLSHVFNETILHYL